MPVILLPDEPGIFPELEGTFLQRVSIELVVAADGDEAVRLAREKAPDLAILVTDPPEAAGLEACRSIKSDPDLRRIPVILVGLPRQRDGARLAGADAFVTKPPTQANLMTRIRRFIPSIERGTTRLPVALKVSCRAGTESFVAFSKDLSSTGLFLKSTRPPERGARLQIGFLLPADRPVPIETEAEVVRDLRPERGSHLIGGAGLRFTSLSAESRISIGRFVRARQGIARAG